MREWEKYEAEHAMQAQRLEQLGPEAREAVRAKGRVTEEGVAEVEFAGHTFTDAQTALEAADSLRDVALRTMHKVQSAAPTYAPPLGLDTSGNLGVGGQQAREFEPGNSPVTGTSPESDAALVRMNPEGAEAQRALAAAQVRREIHDERVAEEVRGEQEEAEQKMAEAEQQAREGDREQTVDVESSDPDRILDNDPQPPAPSGVGPAPGEGDKPSGGKPAGGGRGGKKD
jgi:hypothetical protein